jgi:tripartite ATP-independent transporter DctP family solute receptor
MYLKTWRDNMKAKRIARGVVICLIGFVVVMAGVMPGFAQQAPIKIRYATQLPATHLMTQAEMRMTRMIEERSKGRVKFEFYPAGQLYKSMELLKAVSSGAIEMGTTPSAMLTGPAPLMEVTNIPFLFGNYDEIVKMWNGEVGDMMRKSVERIGIKALAFSAYGEDTSFCAHKPLTKPSDFKGIKIRCNHNIAADWIKAYGGSPVVFSSAEVYEGLQRRTIDAANSGATSIKERKWYEMTEYGTLTYSAYAVWPEMINLKFFNSLPKDIQQIIVDAAQEHQAYLLKATAKADKESIAFLKTKLKMYELTPADKKVWKEAGQKAIIATWLKRAGKDGQKALNWIEANLGKDK